MSVGDISTASRSSKRARAITRQNVGKEALITALANARVADHPVADGAFDVAPVANAVEDFAGRGRPAGKRHREWQRQKGGAQSHIASSAQAG